MLLYRGGFTNYFTAIIYSTASKEKAARTFEVLVLYFDIVGRKSIWAPQFTDTIQYKVYEH